MRVEETPTVAKIASRILIHWVHNTAAGDAAVCALIAQLVTGLQAGTVRLLPEAQPEESAWAGALWEGVHQSPPPGVIGEQLHVSAACRMDAVILIMRALLEGTPGSEDCAEITPFLDDLLSNLGPVYACSVADVLQKSREDIQRLLSEDGVVSVH